MKFSIHAPDRSCRGARQSIEQLTRLGLAKFGSRLREVNVSVRDQNGPKKGHDIHCVVTVRLKGLPGVVIRECHDTPEGAVSLAVDRASRSVSRVIDRSRRNAEFNLAAPTDE